MNIFQLSNPVFRKTIINEFSVGAEQQLIEQVIDLSTQKEKFDSIAKLFPHLQNLGNQYHNNGHPARFIISTALSANYLLLQGNPTRASQATMALYQVSPSNLKDPILAFRNICILDILFMINADQNTLRDMFDGIVYELEAIIHKLECPETSQCLSVISSVRKTLLAGSSNLEDAKERSLVSECFSKIDEFLMDAESRNILSSCVKGHFFKGNQLFNFHRYNEAQNEFEQLKILTSFSPECLRNIRLYADIFLSRIYFREHRLMHAERHLRSNLCTILRMLSNTSTDKGPLAHAEALICVELIRVLRSKWQYKEAFKQIEYVTQIPEFKEDPIIENLLSQTRLNARLERARLYIHLNEYEKALIDLVFIKSQIESSMKGFMPSTLQDCRDLMRLAYAHLGKMFKPAEIAPNSNDAFIKIHTARSLRTSALIFIPEGNLEESLHYFKKSNMIFNEIQIGNRILHDYENLNEAILYPDCVKKHFKIALCNSSQILLQLNHIAEALTDVELSTVICEGLQTAKGKAKTKMARSLILLVSERIHEAIISFLDSFLEMAKRNNEIVEWNAEVNSPANKASHYNEFDGRQAVLQYLNPGFHILLEIKTLYYKQQLYMLLLLRMQQVLKNYSDDEIIYNHPAREYASTILHNFLQYMVTNDSKYRMIENERIEVDLLAWEKYFKELIAFLINWEEGTELGCPLMFNIPRDYWLNSIEDYYREAFGKLDFNKEKTILHLLEHCRQLPVKIKSEQAKFHFSDDDMLLQAEFKAEVMKVDKQQGIAILNLIDDWHAFEISTQPFILKEITDDLEKREIHAGDIFYWQHFTNKVGWLRTQFSNQSLRISS